MANKPAIVNFADAKRQTFGHGEAFKATTARMGAELGAEQIGCALVELEPGKRAWPYHLHYAEEEMFVVLGGEGTLRYDGETYPARPGDVIFTPTGPGTAHQIINTSDTPMRYLALSPRADARSPHIPIQARSAPTENTLTVLGSWRPPTPGSITSTARTAIRKASSPGSRRPRPCGEWPR